MVLVSFSATYLTFIGSQVEIPRPTEPEGLLLFPKEESELTRNGAQVVRKIFYSKSKLEVEERSVLPPELVGLSRQALAERMTNGIIQRFSPDEIVIREIREELAPLHAAKRFLGVQQGHVAVFRGVPGLAYECIQQTDIPTNYLPPQEISDLQKGIPIYNDKNLMEMLMGLSSMAFAD